MLRNVIIVLILCVSVSLRAGAQDLATPEAAVRSFITDVEIGDMREAALCVKGIQLTTTDLDDASAQLKKAPVSFTLRDTRTTIDGPRATVSGLFSIMQLPSTKRTSFSATVSLEQSNRSWQIAPDIIKLAQSPNPDPVSSFAYGLTNATIFRQAQEQSREAECISNLKQQGLATLILIQDWDEKIHLSAATYSKDLTPYVKSQSVFRCPDDNGAGNSYSFNPKLAGIKAAVIHDAAITVLIYEGRSGKLDFRHEGKAAVCFADGHVKLIDVAGAKKLRWIP